MLHIKLKESRMQKLVTNIFLQTPPPDPDAGVNRSIFFQNMVALHIKWKGSRMQQHGSKYFAYRHPTPDRRSQRVKIQLFQNNVMFHIKLVVRSRAYCVPINGDLFQNLQWTLTLNLKVVTYLISTPEASYDVINMATIYRNCSLIKAIVCLVYSRIDITQILFFNSLSFILVTWWLSQGFMWLW